MEISALQINSVNTLHYDESEERDVIAALKAIRGL
jgi:hypothetical protein